MAQLGPVARVCKASVAGEAEGRGGLLGQLSKTLSIIEVGGRDGSEGKVACCQAYRPQFNPWNPPDKRRKLTAAGSLPTSNTKALRAHLVV